MPLDQKLQGSVQGSPNGSLGFDTKAKLSSAMAQGFAEDYTFCVRYISLREFGDAEGSTRSDLTHEEASEILKAGLALMPVQHVPNSGWMPNASLGKQYGTNAASNVDLIGFPIDVTIWCSLEDVNTSASAQDVIDYCNTWYEQLTLWGYMSGLYVGANPGLNAGQLSELKFQHYWKSESDVPDPSTGYQMTQGFTETVNGISINPDRTCVDNQGRVPQLLYPMRLP